MNVRVQVQGSVAKTTLTPVISVPVGFVPGASGPRFKQPIQPEWQRIALPLGLGILLLGALFNKEVAAAIQTWNTSTAYNHCFLIIPITLYLLWDRRFDLTGLHPVSMPAALLLALPLGMAWLATERLGIMEGRQLVAISFIELLFLAMLGLRLWWGMAGPLLYLYFLVPFGEFLTPRLQDITTWFIRQGVDILGIPAYIDGYVIEIPQGAFFVAEACAGLRFLIASIAFGCLYALLMYRSPVRRGLFILASILVPIVANGFRGLGIVVLGYVLDSAQAAAADHIVYGWVFFSFVILLLIMLGLPFRQDEVASHTKTLEHGPKDQPFTALLSVRTMLAVSLGMVTVAAISPTVAASLTIAMAEPRPLPDLIDLGSDCVVRAFAINGSASPAVRTQRAVCDGVAMDMNWEEFSPRITAAPLMAERRRLVQRAATEDASENWLNALDGAPGTWRILHSNDPAFAIAVSVWVDGRPTRPGLAMRAKMALNSLFGTDYAPMVMTVTPAVDWEALDGPARQKAKADLSAFLLSHPDLVASVGSLSAM